MSNRVFAEQRVGTVPVRVKMTVTTTIYVRPGTTSEVAGSKEDFEAVLLDTPTLTLTGIVREAEATDPKSDFAIEVTK